MGEGRFIVLEGGDGVGKTTQAALLSSWFTAVGLPHVSTREPGGTPVGEAIRELVLGRSDLDMPSESELLLILAARAAFVRDVVRPALAQGKLVLADRFSLSTLAYQGFGRGSISIGCAKEYGSPRAVSSRTSASFWIYRSTRVSAVKTGMAGRLTESNAKVKASGVRCATGILHWRSPSRVSR